MRIMYLTESTGWSGGAQQALWMAGSLKRRGQEVLLACQPGSDIGARARAESIPTVEVRMRQDYDVLAARRVAELLKIYQIQVLHAQHSTAHAIGLMAAWWAGTPVFAVTRRVIFPLKRNIFSRFKYLSRRINGYIAISAAVKEELLKAGVSSSRIEVIPSVMNIAQGTPQDRIELRGELGLAAARPVITNVANYADFKGQPYLVRAAAEVLKSVPDVEFLFVGRDVDKLSPLVEQLGLTKSVRLAGFRTDISRILAASDLFVLPSLQEGAGTSLREAMSIGLACIGSRVGGIPESILDGETGVLVPPADEYALAEAIIDLLTHPQKARTMAVRGRAYVQENFTLEPTSAKMEAFYKRLLTSTPA
jgi:glycosyltransferase involved in cell wall biosynthesis